MKKIKNIIKDNIYLLKIIHASSKFRVLFECLFHVLLGIIQTLIYTYLFGTIINTIYISGDFIDILKLVIFVIIATMITNAYCAWYSNIYKSKSDIKIEKHIVNIIYDKASETNIKCFDDPEFYNNFTVALKETKKRAVDLTDLIGQYAGLIATIAALLSIVLTKDVFLLVFFVLSVIPSFILGEKKVSNTFKRYNKSLIFDRKCGYINRVMYLQRYAKEIRLYNDTSQIIENHYQENIDEIIGIHKEHNKKNFKYAYILSLCIDALVYVGDIAYITYKVKQNVLQIGDYFIVINATWGMTWRIKWLIQQVLRLEEFSLYIQKVKTFMNYFEEDSLKLNLDSIKNSFIEFDHVVFRYSDDDNKNIINNLNLKIDENEKIAIVGSNGAGKTTIIKLLLGLYKPQSGSINLKGRNINTYETNELRDHFSNVFQDINMYAFTVGENVAMDNINDDMVERIINTLKKGEIYEKVSKLDEGIKTNMTKEFDSNGFVPSGGEAQKLVIARSIFNDKDIILWDEPSSALDPIIEKKINDLVLKVAKDKTLILISHRLSTVVNMDKIFVIEKGCVVEQGNHEALMSSNGIYASMFNKQALSYREETDVKE